MEGAGVAESASGRMPHDRSFVPNVCIASRARRLPSISSQPLQVPSWVALVTSMNTRAPS